MNRPEFIESLEAAASGASSLCLWKDEPCSAPDCWCGVVDTIPSSDMGVIPAGSVSAKDATHIAAANPVNILELIRYVKVLEGAMKLGFDGMPKAYAAAMAEAKREIESQEGTR